MEDGNFMRWIADRKIRLVIPGLFAALAFVLFMAMPPGTHAASATEGQELFKAHCASCHGPDGKAQTSMGKMLKIKDLSSEEVQKKSDAELHDIIAKGKKPMPAYGTQLKKEQIDDLVAYIRELGKKK
jgi:mono/diheme cytochrome c family protein